jgi:hypothetical protein
MADRTIHAPCGQSEHQPSFFSPVAAIAERATPCDRAITANAQKIKPLDITGSETTFRF